MNRTDELTDALIDGTLTAAEADELAALLAADPAARARHVALLDVEAALRGLRTDLDLGAATVARIEAERAERTVAAVMAGIAAAPARKSRRRVIAALVALAAGVVVAVLALRPAPAPVAPAAPEFARLTGVTGAVEVVGPAGPVALGPDQRLAPGQTVRTVGEDSAAFVEFPDRTRVELHPDTALRLDDDAGAARRLFLVQGQLTADVAGAATVVSAGSADVVATRGRFDLWASGPGSVRVELRDGDVRVVPGEAARAVALSAGRAAFVRDADSPVRVEAPYRVDDAPRGRLDFPGAYAVAFTPDGSEVWAASAKQLVRWHVGPDGFGAGFTRDVFPPAVHNDGHAAVITADGRTLVACRVDDRADRVLVRDLPGGAVRQSIPVRASEARFLCAAPDGSWVATTGGRPDKRLRVWDAATGAERFAHELEANPFCTAATPDGRYAAAELTDLGRGTNNKVVFVNAATGVAEFALPTRRRQTTALAFSADGRYMAAGFNGAVQLWDVPARTLVRTIEGFERVVMRLAFSPDGRMVAGGTGDGQVWVWDAATGRRTQVIQTGTRGVRALAFRADGRLLVTATNKAPVALWEIAAPGGEPNL